MVTPETGQTGALVIPGSVSVAGDAEPLRVRFVVTGERISLRSGEAELGSWSLSSVSVEPAGDGVFAFTADGETVTFQPDEPAAFSRLAIISANTTKSRRRKRSRPEPAQPRPAPQHASPARSERVTEPVRPRPQKARGKGAAQAAGMAGRVAVGLGRRTWLFALDQARERNLFGLDRVQMTIDMRDDPNHDHTWDHRIANGLAKYVCTVCGRIRLNAD